MIAVNPLLWATIGLASVANCLPASSKAAASSKPAYFALAGDSTTASSNGKSGGGWGDGFLNYTLASGSTGHNYGHNGATTASFVSGGDWATVLSTVKSKTADYNVFVTIQFGHNDQKSTSGVSEDQYLANLKKFAQQVQALGATPILVTPLSRRKFSGTPARVVESLATQRNLTIKAASATGSRYIDLNKASTDYLNAIGPTASYKYNLAPDDYTHLNLHGSVVFGRLVSDLLVAKYADIKAVTKADATLSAKIAKGVAA